MFRRCSTCAVRFGVLVALLVAAAPLVGAAPGPQTWRVSAGANLDRAGRIYWGSLADSGAPVGGSDLIATAPVFEPANLDIHAGDSVVFQFHWKHALAIGRDDLPWVDPATNEPNPASVLPTGGSSYNGTGVVQSGLLDGPPPPSWTVAFTQPGDYPVICDIHDGMKMTVHVHPVAESLPLTPDQVLASQAPAFAGLFDAGEAQALDAARVQTVDLDGQTALAVSGGFGGESVLGARFVPQDLVVHAGDWVQWTNPSRDEGHTITLVPGGGRFGTDQGIVNPWLAAGGNVYDGTNFVNLPLVVDPDLQTDGVGPSGAIQFTAPGQYTYTCIIHTAVRMEGTITVLPR